MQEYKGLAPGLWGVIISLSSMTVLVTSLYLLSPFYLPLLESRSLVTGAATRILIFALSIGFILAVLRLYVYILDRSRQQELDEIRKSNQTLFEEIDAEMSRRIWGEKP
jgi:Ni,Fe-hydrogenase I cytochrome b subunit